MREPLTEWYAGCAASLLTALEAVDPDETVPNFARLRENAGFWRERQLHETTIHAVDGAQSLGRSEPVGASPTTWPATASGRCSRCGSRA